jgi:Zn-dependent peptidase ImmA (M78 family)
MADIQVLDPADYRLSKSEMLRDMEFTIVHELIHLHLGSMLSDVNRTEANRREEEQAVNHLAAALLKLDRK